MAIMTAVWLGICAIWAGLLVAQVTARRRGVFLEASPRGLENRETPGVPWPTVCVVIPARNERRQIADCLGSVLAQDYPALEVRVVDDRSEDGTGAVVARIAESDSRVVLTRNDGLPRDWLGKSHALWHGTRGLSCEWILFIDADCLLAPCALRVAVDEASRRNAGLLTLWPRMRAESFWEHVLIPLCAAIISLWYGSDRVNAPGGKRAFANGQFLLIRRTDYERIGGHRQVRGALIEDIPLAEHAQQAGIRCQVASGRELFSVRMYASYPAIRDGWARIYVGALRSSLKIAASVAWLAIGSLFPFIAALILFVPVLSGLLSARIDPSTITSWRWCCGLHLGLLLIVSYRFWGFGACRRTYLIVYPLSVVLVMRILWRAWWWLTIKRSVSWSETTYRIDRHGAIIG